jgi:DNA-binding NarL/FixJ family response regulator
MSSLSARNATLNASKFVAKITVLLADDHTLVRQGLKALLMTEEDMQVVAEAENGQEAVALAKKMTPDIVIMDLAMPMMNGLNATRQILKAVPGTRVLVLSSYSDDECVKQMMQAGATGFLMKQTASSELAQAIRNVRRGNQVLSPPIAQRMRNQRHGAFMEGADTQKSTALTAREVEVLKIIADGYSNKEVAAMLEISIKTVEKHRQQVMNKLNIHDVAGLTRYALSRGMIDRQVPAPAA